MKFLDGKLGKTSSGIVGIVDIFQINNSVSAVMFLDEVSFEEDKPQEEFVKEVV